MYVHPTLSVSHCLIPSACWEGLSPSVKAETELSRVVIGSQWTLWSLDRNMMATVIMFGNTCDALECVLAQLSEASLRYSHNIPVRPVQLTHWTAAGRMQRYKGNTLPGITREGCWLCVLTLQIIIQKMAQLSRPARFHEETLNLLSVCQSAHLQDLLASSVQPSNAVSFDDLL